jgi:tetratricopeptide (TPR) repeat protein
VTFRRLKRCLQTISLLGLFAFSPVFSQSSIPELEMKLKANPNDQQALMDLGRSYYDEAAAGETNSIDKGIRCFDQALMLDSTNAVALAYRGSLWTMEARNSWWPPNKMKYLKRGGEELDRAVDLEPDNIMVRLIRGINGLGLPSYADRLQTSLEDFLIVLKHPDFPNQSRQLKVVAFYYGGLALKRADDYEKARELFERAISILPDSEYAKRAREELKDMGS